MPLNLPFKNGLLKLEDSLRKIMALSFICSLMMVSQTMIYMFLSCCASYFKLDESPLIC